MTNLPPVNEETVIFKSDRQAAGKVCKKFKSYKLLCFFVDWFFWLPICPKKSLVILVDEQSKAPTLNILLSAFSILFNAKCLSVYWFNTDYSAAWVVLPLWVMYRIFPLCLSGTLLDSSSTYWVRHSSLPPGPQNEVQKTLRSAVVPILFWFVSLSE